MEGLVTHAPEPMLADLSDGDFYIAGPPVMTNVVGNSCPRAESSWTGSATTASGRGTSPCKGRRIDRFDLGDTDDVRLHFVGVDLAPQSTFALYSCPAVCFARPERVGIASPRFAATEPITVAATGSPVGTDNAGRGRPGSVV